jgi:hypothetical protein
LLSFFPLGRSYMSQHTFLTFLSPSLCMHIISTYSPLFFS